MCGNIEAEICSIFLAIKKYLSSNIFDYSRSESGTNDVGGKSIKDGCQIA